MYSMLHACAATWQPVSWLIIALQPFQLVLPGGMEACRLLVPALLAMTKSPRTVMILSADLCYAGCCGACLALQGGVQWTCLYY